MQWPEFPVELKSIEQRIASIDPVGYSKTRNFIDGNVTYLSPYISRGVISTKYVLQQVIARGYKPDQIEKFIQELAWRDYWQQVWRAKGDEINTDLRQPQQEVSNYKMPAAIINGNTGLKTIDESIRIFYETGYLHNHVRMYLASMICNMGRSHWKVPAQWMFYHLLDADWASNALSWQWVAGANSKKKYYFNQENLNKYTRGDQKKTFLDVPYEAFNNFAIPEALTQTKLPTLEVKLPDSQPLAINPDLPVFIYNFYNLDPNWQVNISANRLLLFEPEVFEKYPVSEKTIQFVMELAGNIPSIQFFTGSFSELKAKLPETDVFFKEHPLNSHYIGKEQPRDWMTSVEGYFPSFFAFWKKAKKELDL